MIFFVSNSIVMVFESIIFVGIRGAVDKGNGGQPACPGKWKRCKKKNMDSNAIVMCIRVPCIV
jgi:hypothetical protein